MMSTHHSRQYPLPCSVSLLVTTLVASGTAFHWNTATALEIDLNGLPWYQYDTDSEEDDDEDELEFDEFELYFELNNTDGDLGIHSVIDGEPWSRLIYEDTRGRRMIDVKLKGSMAKQGLTEFFFESSEPPFDELAPEVFFSRFPDGIYDAEGITVDYEEIEGEAELSSVLPAAPVLYIGDGGFESNEGCEDDPALDPTASLDADGGLPVQWDAVTLHHPTLGSPGEIEVDIYQLVFEVENSHLTIDLDPDITQFTLPPALLNSGDTVKLEVIVRDSTHNQVATEACVTAI